ncbi:MAG: YraN family protein [Desulforudis sp.]|nr:YraN family protein [Clostridia bacterium]MDQ7791083.1 YraN family protein [Clostridia bacterium]RJX17869.1 MAG: YraN family protein [Desulforudis sp.]
MRLELGRKGESIALDYLCKKGFTILETNYRCRLGEIDIIARDGRTLVFAEVRSRTRSSFGTPQETVNHRKQRKLAQVAEFYLMSLKDIPPVRFDVIGLTFNADGTLEKVEHIRNAF